MAEALRWNEDNARAIRDGISPLMKWHLKDLHVQWIDKVPLKLKQPFDLEFIHRYGTVFKVFDDQDSGNLCFEVQDGDRRYFVKFAGAPVAMCNGDISDAIERLKNSAQIYKDLTHPSLIRFVGAEEVGGGFAVVFDWVDAICAHRMYPADYQAFRKLPIEVKERIFEEVLEFHVHAAKRGYVAIDFYDGSIMWDLANKQTVICDIDFYMKSPAVRQIWGCDRFLSPEERIDGSVVDEVTTVYTMGATAFCLLSNSDRSREAWPLAIGLYDVARRAVSDERRDRQQSIRQLMDEWEEELGKMLKLTF
jgi:serine/threonine-protein kinase